MSTQVETIVEHVAMRSSNAPYSGFEQQYIGGKWKLCQGSRTFLEDSDPFLDEFSTVHWETVQLTPMRYPF
jgi:hypothetical protein